MFQLSITHSSRVSGLSNKTICSAATVGRWETRPNYLPHVKEAKKRGLRCGVGASASAQVASASTVSSSQPIIPGSKLKNKEIKFFDPDFAALEDALLCRAATTKKSGKTSWKVKTLGQFPARKHVTEAKRRGLTCGVAGASSTQVASSTPTLSDNIVCEYATYRVGTAGNYITKWTKSKAKANFVEEAKGVVLLVGWMHLGQRKLPLNRQIMPSY